jgi:xanthosine utilization system XapX-like protein
MSAITEDQSLLAAQTGLSFDPVCYSMETPDGEHTGSEASWQVQLRPKGHLITRQVSLDGKPWEQCGYRWAPETVIWPAWPGKSADEAATAALPLAGVEEYWRTVGNRLRDSAKWMATVLGAALAAVAGTSPLAGMREHAPPAIAVISGALGLILLGVTLLLVIQVMRPQSVSYTEVQCARRRRWGPQRPLYKWRQTIESQQDLYLPCGIKCLTGLRQSMIIEEITLMAISQARAAAKDPVSAQQLCDALSARAARLSELRVAAARIAAVGEYYKLRHRSTWATYGGVASGLLATATIVAAFAWPLH